MGRSVNQKESFLSPCLCYGINLRENSYTIWMPCTSQGFWKSPFPSPSRKHTFAGIPLKTPSIRKTGALISKKHSMDLAMQSNILDAIPTRLLSLTAGSFLSRKSKNLKLIFKLQGYQKFKQRYASLGMTDLLSASWGFDSPWEQLFEAVMIKKIHYCFFHFWVEKSVKLVFSVSYTHLRAHET